MGIIKITLFLLISISLITLVSASQEEVRLKECSISYDDVDFGAWDGAKGVIERATNTNPNFGADEYPTYTNEFYQAERPYFDEEGYSGANSKIPTLKLEEGENKYLYIKCIFETGPRTLTYIDVIMNRFQGKLTNDFNITLGLVNNAEKISETWMGYPLSYTEDILASQNQRPRSSLSTDTSSGILPYTEFYKVMRWTEMDDFPTGLFYTRLMFYGEGTLIMMSPEPEFYFYFENENIENTEISEFLCPTIIGRAATNLETGEVASDWSTVFEIFPTNNVEICFTLENKFSTALTGIYVSDNLKSDDYGMGNLGGPTTDVTKFEIYSSRTLDMSAGEIIDVCETSTLPETVDGKPVIIPRFSSSFKIYNQRDMNCAGSNAVYGSDNVSYLGIKGMTTFINFNMEERTAVFDILMGLQVGPAYGVDDDDIIKIYPGDYSIITRIYEDNVDPDYLALEIETILDDAEFLEIGETVLNKNDFEWFNLQIPIEGELQNADAVYIAKFYTKKLTEPFYNLIISYIEGTPYFEPGSIFYIGDNVLNFGSDSKTDSEKIILFNPSFRTITVNLNIESWSDTQNFSLSWDASTFSTNPTNTITLYPLQSKDITFWVKSSYDPWVTSPKIETLEISATTTLEDEDGNPMTRTESSQFTLNVRNDELNWVNLNQITILPDSIEINDLDASVNQRVTARWMVEGSESGLSANEGIPYTVTMSLINDTDGAILEEITQTFALTEGIMEMDFTHDFIYGNYTIELKLDTTYQIDEHYSSELSAEDDNIQTYDLPVLANGCFLIGNYLYTFDYWGTQTLDTAGACNCPTWLTMVPGTGYCADPNSGLCYTFGTHLDCNNWITTLPGMCGWEANTIAITNPGDCEECSEIAYSCSGYNNEETCNIDPCNKASYDCANLACDDSQTYQCEWETATNDCIFTGIIGGHNCHFLANIIQECDGTNEEMIIDYTTTDAGCTNMQKSFSCAMEVLSLDFFSKMSFIITIIIIGLFYKIRKK